MNKKAEKYSNDDFKCNPVILCPPKGAAALFSEGRSIICIVRHGQTDWNTERRLQGRECVPLNDIGRAQAEDCACTIDRASHFGLRFKKIFTSPLSRAEETARIIARGTGVDSVETEELLIERNYGELSGLTLAERRIKFPFGEKQAAGVEPPSGAASRMMRAMCKIHLSAPGEIHFAVSHGGILNAMFHKVTGGRIGTGKNISPNCGVSMLAVNARTSIPLVYGLKGDAFLNYIEELFSYIKTES